MNRVGPARYCPRCSPGRVSLNCVLIIHRADHASMSDIAMLRQPLRAV